MLPTLQGSYYACRGNLLNGSWYTLRPYNVSTSIGLERNEVIALDPGTLVEFYIEDVEGNNLNTLVLFNFNLITT